MSSTIKNIGFSIPSIRLISPLRSNPRISPVSQHLFFSPYKYGYSFKGWYNGDTQVTADSKANATISVTSKWDPNQYTLTYNNNGGTGCTSKKGYYKSFFKRN